jgi:hypothetical protein
VKSRISPEVELVYSQLLWIERRRFRLVESVSVHFGHALVQRVLSTGGLSRSPLENEPDFVSLLDEREPEEFLAHLASEVEKNEAATITRLRSHVSIYREHVDEQILFGARTAGQEAARSFLSLAPMTRPRPALLSVPEAVQAIFELNYTGLPGEKNHFLMLRSQGGSTVHFARSPHLEAWNAVGAEPKFLYQARCEWVRGILDIASPQIEFSTAQAIEQGGPYGLEHFFLRGQHAGP